MNEYEASINEHLNDRNTVECINNSVKDLVSSFLYYDRKEAGDLPRGKIEEAIKDGLISEDEIADLFKLELIKGLK